MNELRRTLHVDPTAVGTFTPADLTPAGLTPAGLTPAGTSSRDGAASFGESSLDAYLGELHARLPPSLPSSQLSMPVSGAAPKTPWPAKLPELGAPSSALSSSASSSSAAPTTPLQDARDALRDPERCAVAIARHAARLGVPASGFRGQVDVVQHGRPRLSWAMAHLRSEASQRALTTNLEAATPVYGDRALLLAVTMRERASSWTARGHERIDTFHQGGLDHLDTDRHRMRALVPQRVLDRWEPGSRGSVDENGDGHSVSIASAQIPARDQLIAYAATLRLREQTFESHVREVFGADADAMLAHMSPDARRAWVQATFGRPGRTHYDAVHQAFERSSRPPHPERPSAFGALERIAAEASRTGTPPSLEAIFTDPLLSRHATFQRARVTALEARVIEESGLATPRGES